MKGRSMRVKRDRYVVLYKDDNYTIKTWNAYIKDTDKNEYQGEPLTSARSAAEAEETIQKIKAEGLHTLKEYTDAMRFQREHNIELYSIGPFDLWKARTPMYYPDKTKIARYTMPDGACIYIKVCGDIKIQDKKTGEIYENINDVPDEVLNAVFLQKTESVEFRKKYKILQKNRFVIYRRGQKNGVEITKIPESLKELANFFDDLGTMQRIIGDMSAAL